ncbi:MAG: 6-phosphogluconolactonase [Deltaproteobacteria bacterium]|nr:6-phosphogluconolactonase [Deltaproteobacteria bacterium]
MTIEAGLGVFEVQGDGEAVAQRAAALIIATARARPPVGLLLAGGSTAKRACEVVAASADAADFAGVHVWPVDDRAIALADPGSNGGMILRLWAGLGYASADPRFHAVVEGDVAAQVAALEAALRALGGVAPRPDLTLLGVGGDGHVGGLTPGSAMLEAAGLFACPTGPRISATRGLITASKQLVIALAGAAKADILAQMMANSAGFPASAIARETVAAGGAVTWIADRAAAATLPT